MLLTSGKVDVIAWQTVLIDGMYTTLETVWLLSVYRVLFVSVMFSCVFLCIEFTHSYLLQAVSVYIARSSDIYTVEVMCFYEVVAYL